MARNATHATLGVISFGLALGVAWGLSVCFLALAAGLFGWGTALALTLQGLYFGFAPTLPGAIAGAVWGFANGLILGILVAWFYNRFLLSRQLHVRPLHHHEPSTAHPAPNPNESPAQGASRKSEPKGEH
ncbi:MAG: bacteriophage holin [Methyloligellaceae bacterium]